MACRTGLLPADCITDHWLPELDGRTEPIGTRAGCPICGTRRALSIQAIRGRIVWNHHCRCPADAIGKVLAVRVACYTAPRRRKPAADLDEIRALVLDRNITVSALRLGVLEALGMSTAEAAETLKLPRKTLSDARRKLAINRRSRDRRILATATDPPVAKTRHKPQVKRVGNDI